MITYEPFFETLERKNMTAYQLEQKGFSRSTYYDIKHGKGITTHTINRLCNLLGCDITDIVKYTPDEIAEEDN